MCRWAAYIGAPIYLEEIVSRPAHSLIHQSHCATECRTAINADGFGVAWYADRPEPGLYRDVMPAWSDPNLRSLVATVKSGLFLAHVRASTGTATSRNNCHPFTCGRWSFMHNGQVGGYDGFRRHADMLIPDALYPYRKGATDSEALFLAALAEGLIDIICSMHTPADEESKRLPFAQASFGIIGLQTMLPLALERRAPPRRHTAANAGWVFRDDPSSGRGTHPPPRAGRRRGPAAAR